VDREEGEVKIRVDISEQEIRTAIRAALAWKGVIVKNEDIRFRSGPHESACDNLTAEVSGNLDTLIPKRTGVYR
jgi:hypothetical protein